MAKKNENTEASSVDTSNVEESGEALVHYPKGLNKYGVVKEILKTNLGENAQLGFSDLTKIPMPAGGGTVFQVPQSDGTEKNFETIEGVIVAFQDVKSFWAGSIDDTGGGSPPDCRSMDLVQGHGTPGILCAECPNNEFGSAQKGNGKACKDLRMLYILTDASILPQVIVAPPTSLKSVKKFFLGLAAEDEVPYYGVQVRISLVKDKNDDGIAFSRLVFTKKNILDESTMLKAQAYNEMLKPMLNAMFASVFEANSTHDGEDDTNSESDYIDVEASRQETVSTEPEAAYD